MILLLLFPIVCSSNSLRNFDVFTALGLCLRVRFFFFFSHVCVFCFVFVFVCLFVLFFVHLLLYFINLQTQYK